MFVTITGNPSEPHIEIDENIPLHSPLTLTGNPGRAGESV